MKTQIIHRIVLIAAIMLISYSNKGDNAQTNMSYSPVTILKTESSFIKKTFAAITSNAPAANTSISCTFCAHQQDYPVIPEPNGEHEFHSFHVKDKTHKPLGFWRTVANKILEAVYYIVVLFTLVPFKH